MLNPFADLNPALLPAGDGGPSAKRYPPSRRHALDLELDRSCQMRLNTVSTRKRWLVDPEMPISASGSSRALAYIG
jgi:hypothetical protein